MIRFFAKFFIKDSSDLSNEKTRSAYGMLCGGVGIVLNIFLFAFKLFAGILSGSVAVTADAFNNLSDAGSSVITLIGFRLAAQKPDKDHPFGHGRLEYISGLAVAFVILLMGFELFKDSFDRILHPLPLEISVVTFIVLSLSVFVKIYMCIYNRTYGKKLDSPAMRATSADSLSDAIATSVVMLSMILSHFTSINLDGFCGLAVAFFILYAGFNAARDTISPLLGKPPSEEFVEQIRSIVMSYSGVRGIHDLIVHDYGPGRLMISLHAEVDEKADLLETHDMIDNIERYLSEKLGCSAVIHMDPIAADDMETAAFRAQIDEFVKTKLYAKASIHDFRMVRGNTHTNIIFDVVMPYEANLADEEIKKAVREYLETLNDRYFAVITVDRSYI